MDEMERQFKMNLDVLDASIKLLEFQSLRQYEMMETLKAVRRMLVLLKER